MNTWIQHAGYQQIDGKNCCVTLESRPHYCDRGNFIAKLHVQPFVHPTILNIDAEDLWPRYYFDEGRAKAEVEAWLDKRGQRT